MRIRTRRTLVVGTASLVAVAAIGAAQAMTPAPARTPAADRPAAAPAPQPLSTPSPPPGPPDWTKAGLTIDTTEQQVKKAKITFNLPKLTALAYPLAVQELPRIRTSPGWTRRPCRT